MSHNEAIDELNIKIGGVQYVIPVLCATNQPSDDMIIGKYFQMLCSPCRQTKSQIIFIINGHTALIDKLHKAYAHQKIEITRSSEYVIPTQCDSIKYLTT